MHIVIAANDTLIVLIVYLDPIPAMVFGRIAGKSRGGQGFAFCSLLRKLCDTDTDRNLQCLVALQVSEFVAILANDIDELHGLFEIAVRQQDDEIIASQPGRDCVIWQDISDQLCKSNDDFVARLTTEGIVDQLEIIEVEIYDLVRILCVHQGFC